MKILILIKLICCGRVKSQIKKNTGSPRLSHIELSFIPLSCIINCHPQSVFNMPNSGYCTVDKHFKQSHSGTVCEPSQHFSFCMVSETLYLCSYSSVYLFLQEIFSNSKSHHAQLFQHQWGVPSTYPPKHAPNISPLSRAIKLCASLYFLSPKCQKSIWNNRNLRQEITLEH
jgi:hypothetical protein